MVKNCLKENTRKIIEQAKVKRHEDNLDHLI